MTLNDIDYSFVVDMLSYMLCYKGRYQIEGEKVHNVNYDLAYCKNIFKKGVTSVTRVTFPFLGYTGYGGYIKIKHYF